MFIADTGPLHPAGGALPGRGRRGADLLPAGQPRRAARQFTSTYYIGYTDKQGQYLTGDAGYVAAIKAGYFKVIAYNYQTTPAWTRSLAQTLAADPDYSLADVIPNGNDTVRQYIWVKTG